MSISLYIREAFPRSDSKILFKHFEWLLQHQGDRIWSQKSYQATRLHRVRRGEGKAELIGEAVDLLVSLHPYLHLWSPPLGSDQKNVIADTSGRNELSPKGAWPPPWRSGEKSSHLRGAQ